MKSNKTVHKLTELCQSGKLVNTKALSPEAIHIRDKCTAYMHNFERMYESNFMFSGSNRKRHRYENCISRRECDIKTCFRSRGVISQLAGRHDNDSKVAAARQQRSFENCFFLSEWAQLTSGDQFNLIFSPINCKFRLWQSDYGSTSAHSFQ